MKKTFWVLRMKMLKEKDGDSLALFEGKPICRPSGAVVNSHMVAWLSDKDGDQIPGYKDLKWEDGPAELVLVEKKAFDLVHGIIHSQQMMIAKLKCCGNCEHDESGPTKEPCFGCDINSKWQLRQW